ncbi:MAG: hypothetical protein J6Q15_02025, partial [Clostridia bacterium]|nr:hypothetical protein [Clostridia bacterium]
SMDLGEITIVELINKINIYLVENSFDPMEYFELNGVKVIEFIDSIDAVIINWNLLTVAGEYTLTIVV